MKTDSLVGPLLFNIYMNDLFFFYRRYLIGHADDTTAYYALDYLALIHVISVMHDYYIYYFMLKQSKFAALFYLCH